MRVCVFQCDPSHSKRVGWPMKSTFHQQVRRSALVVVVVVLCVVIVRVRGVSSVICSTVRPRAARQMV